MLAIPKRLKRKMAGIICLPRSRQARHHVPILAATDVRKRCQGVRAPSPHPPPLIKKPNAEKHMTIRGRGVTIAVNHHDVSWSIHLVLYVLATSLQ